ncbi:MAG: beta-lactamase regulating signal transducer with metallopeptidase domain [Clostridium sp.]
MITSGAKEARFINLLFKAILISSARGSFLVIIILLIKKVFKNRLSASWHYYIWMLLILRLAMLYSYQSPLSIFNVFTKTLSNIEVSLNISSIKNSEAKQSNVNNNDTVVKNPITIPVTNIKDIKTGDLDLFNIASIIWFIVMLGTLLFMFIFNMIFNKSLSKQEICNDKETLYILKSCQDMTSIKRYIPISYSSNISGVSLYGTFKPKILLSSKIIYNFTQEQKKYIFLHELIHLKYKDILINSIMLTLVAFNWFNPIIWYSYYRMKQDCELACDEKVLYYLQPNCYYNYGSTIISMAELFSKSHNIFNGAALASNKSNLKKRIRMINSFKGKSFKWSIIGLTVITLIALVCLVNPKASVSSYVQTQSNLDTKSEVAVDYQNVFQNFLDQKNLKVVVNSVAIQDIQLPSDFKAVKDGINVGDLLKRRNELSKLNKLDFSKYMGQRIKMYTSGIEAGDSKLNYDVVILLAENKVVGYWIDAGMKDPKQNRPDFNVLVNLLMNFNLENTDTSKLLFSKENEKDTNDKVKIFLNSFNNKNGVYSYEDGTNERYLFLNAQNVKEGEKASYFTDIKMEVKQGTLFINFNEKYTDDYKNKEIDNRVLYKIIMQHKNVDTIRIYKNGQETHFDTVYATE